MRAKKPVPQKGKTTTASSASGGAATGHGVEYQVKYATRLALALMHEQMAAPHLAYQITMEPRSSDRGSVTAWDISTAPDGRLIEAKLQPTTGDVQEWIQRIARSGSPTAPFDLVFSNRGGKLESLVRLLRIAKEADDPRRFDELVTAEKVKDEFGVRKTFAARTHEFLRRMSVVNCREAFLDDELVISARFLVGAAKAGQAVDYLFRKLTAAMTTRTTLRMSELVIDLRAEGMEVYAPPEVDHRGLDAHVVETLAVLSILNDPVPIEVLAAARHLSIVQLTTLLRPLSDKNLLSIAADAVVSAPSLRVDFAVHDPKTTFATALEELLDYLSRKPSMRAAQRRNVTVLAQKCTERPKPVARTFQVMDKTLKQLGDKHEVLKMAALSVSAARQLADTGKRNEDAVKCEAQALICGISWVYQRINRLADARSAATKSLDLGSSIGWDRNTAFCHKCIGRLCRMEAEAEVNQEARSRHYAESIKLLELAINEFSALGGFGSESPEVGDCLSLLGRTYLSMGRVEDADAHARRALRLLTDKSNKDYIDLAILLGDVAVAQGHPEEGFSWYGEAIALSEDGGAEVTEMRARALRQRGRLHARRSGESQKAIVDLDAAAQIWLKLGENDLAASAQWDGWLLKNDPGQALRKLLEAERPLVRMNTIRAHEAQLAKHRRGATARREEPGTEYWRQLVKQAQAQTAIEDVAW